MTNWKRSSFVFAGIQMCFGPFLVVTPTNPIVLKKETVFKRMVRGAHKEETRRTALGVFALLTVIQLFVVYSLFDVLVNDLNMSLPMTLCICIGYWLVCLFYLVIFYGAMMKKEIVIKGINLLDVIRRNLVWRGERVQNPCEQRGRGAQGTEEEEDHPRQWRRLRARRDALTM